MDDERKCFTRPKVRFSRSAELTNQSEPHAAFAKPKITSIVDLKPPVKILKNSSSTSSSARCSNLIETNLRFSAGDSPNDLDLCPLKTPASYAPFSAEIVLTPENRSAREASLSDKKETPKIPEISPKEDSMAKKENHSGKSSLSKSDDASKSSKQRAPKLLENRRGKENIASQRESKENIPRVPQNTPKSQSESGSKSTSNKVPRAAAAEKKSKVANAPNDKEVRKPVKSKLAPIGLMPCMKAAKTRCKSAPAKKTILREATATPSQVYVGRGIVRPRSLEPEVRPQKPMRSQSEIHSGDKLKRPEYNSIVNTIRELQHAREEKVGEDFERLPPAYRRLINGKVSSALDFGANEAIYRDLVDLSIDEKQLPSRLTRSKDPEPRHRDLVPKLSDFFVPINDEEFRKAVLVRPPSPRVLDTWNPYKVSDRIFSWKESLDHDL